MTTTSMPERARERDLLDRGDRAVDRDQQVRAARGQLLDRRAREPVAVVDPARQVPVDVRAERAQRAHEDRGRAHAVDVVVAVDGDPRPALDVLEDPPRRPSPAPARPPSGCALAGGQERARGLRLPQPAPHQHLREHVRAASSAASRAAAANSYGVTCRRACTMRRRLGAREDGNRAHSDMAADFPAGFFERAPGTRRSSTTRRSRRSATSTAISGSTAACSTSAARSADHFDVPPDELVAFDGDPDERCPTATTPSTTCSARTPSARSRARARPFAEVARVLRPGGRFVCTFAGAHAPGEVRGWVATDDAGRVRIVRALLRARPAPSARPRATCGRRSPARATACGRCGLRSAA